MSPSPDDSSKDWIFDFAHLFDAIDGNFSRRSPVPEHLLENFFDTVVTSAISKCIDFNLLVNRELESELLPFFLMANSRSICEDLIYISFMRRLDRNHSNDLAAAIHWQKFRKNIMAQTNFFAKNNPMQPTVGALHAIKEQKSEIDKATAHLRQAWKGMGFSSVPSIRRLSLKVGLTTTYEYVYHMSSNFVHFNPGQLLRQGWEPHQGPFDFSAAHFANYHSDVCRYRCFADCLTTDFPDYFARRVPGFPTVFRDRRKVVRLARCRTAVDASSRFAAPSLRSGPVGDPPPSARLSVSMAVSTAFGHGPIARRIAVAGA